MSLVELATEGRITIKKLTEIIPYKRIIFVTGEYKFVLNKDSGCMDVYPPHKNSWALFGEDYNISIFYHNKHETIVIVKISYIKDGSPVLVLENPAVIYNNLEYFMP